VKGHAQKTAGFIALRARTNIKKHGFGGGIRAILKEPNDPFVAANVQAICVWLSEQKNCVVESQVGKRHRDGPGSTGTANSRHFVVKKCVDRLPGIQSVQLRTSGFSEAKQPEQGKKPSAGTATHKAVAGTQVGVTRAEEKRL
jgi:hypothetical protein